MLTLETDKHTSVSDRAATLLKVAPIDTRLQLASFLMMLLAHSNRVPEVFDCFSVWEQGSAIYKALN